MSVRTTSVGWLGTGASGRTDARPAGLLSAPGGPAALQRPRVDICHRCSLGARLLAVRYTMTDYSTVSVMYFTRSPFDLDGLRSIGPQMPI